MQYRSQSGFHPPLKLARGLLRRTPDAQVLGGGAAGRSDLCRWRSGLRKRPDGENDTDYLQQELFVLVAAWLAADEVFRAGIRGGRDRAGRCVGTLRNPAAAVVDPGAVPAP